MDIFVQLKAVGKTRDILTPTPYKIPDGLQTLRELLTALVRNEVTRYNNRGTETRLLPFLTQQEINDQAKTGKVSFSTLYSDKKADVSKAVANAIQCWDDGLVRVFMNGEELAELDAPLTIPRGAVFTFMRLTFLTGSIW